MYVYIQSERNPDLWTVGFYTPGGEWIPESDHGNPEDAAERVYYLNGKQAGHRSFPIRVAVLPGEEGDAEEEAIKALSTRERAEALLAEIREREIRQAFNEAIIG
jgi:DNA-directed RNA polymerase specialized sigma24 family protein